MTMTIYVRLTNEVVRVWRPVRADEVDASLYRLVPEQVVPDDEVWEFEPGQCVKVERRELSGGEALVAVEAA